VENKNPLVSIVVITYNSSKYVLETLESEKEQTYQNIELIVSDDCSTDNTVDICRNWIEENKDRFVRTELITVEKNTGFASNCNRGCKVAQGEWIKLIAEDDALLFTCIEDNINFILNHPETKMIHSKALMYKDCFTDNNYIATSPVNSLLSENFSAKEQFTILSFKNTIFAVTVFIKKETFISLGEYDESIGLCEDYPIMLHKLLNVMGKRDSKYQLSGQVELYNAFVTTLIPNNQKDEKLKRGAGSQNKSKVMVMTESSVVENPQPNRPPRKVNHIKMQLVPDLKADTAAKIVKEQVDYQSDIQSDDLTTYKKLNECVHSHQLQVVKPEELPKLLPWVHICIGNVKRLLLDMHHQLKNEYLQYYLDEFCYKFNRRYFGEKMFDRLMLVAASYPTDFKSKIYNRTLCG